MSPDPRTRLLLLLCVGVLAISLDGPVPLGALAALTALPLLLGVSPRWLLRGAAAVAVVVWSTMLSQGLFFADLPRTPLIEVGPVIVWRQGVVWGLVQSLRFVATLLAGISVAALTPPDRLYAALLRLRVPYGLAFLGAMSLRTVPVTLRSIAAVRAARARRGRPLHHRSPLAWLRLEVQLLQPVVADSLRRARALAESLDSRGFAPDAPRAVRRPLAFAPWEPPLLLLAVAATVAVAAARLLFVLYSADLLYLPALRPLYGFVRAWL